MGGAGWSLSSYPWGLAGSRPGKLGVQLCLDARELRLVSNEEVTEAEVRADLPVEQRDDVVDVGDRLHRLAQIQTKSNRCPVAQRRWTARGIASIQD